MSESIVSRDTIRARAREAFFAGRARDSHEMNWHAPALVDWLAEYDRLVAERAHDIAVESRRATRMAKTLPHLHDARVGSVRFDKRQAIS